MFSSNVLSDRHSWNTRGLSPGEYPSAQVLSPPELGLELLPESKAIAFLPVDSKLGLDPAQDVLDVGNLALKHRQS
jgi:hypothetical protein